jgi:hypothetical protein
LIAGRSPHYDDVIRQAQNLLTQTGGKYKKYYLPPLNSLILKIQNALRELGADSLMKNILYIIF